MGFSGGGFGDNRGRVVVEGGYKGWSGAGRRNGKGVGGVKLGANHGSIECRRQGECTEVAGERVRGIGV